MKCNRISLLLLAGAILLQCFCMRNGSAFDYELPFFSGLLAADSMSGNLLLTLYSIIPMPFLLMFFAGDMDDVTRGYGKLLLIRSYGKGRLMAHLTGRLLLYVTAVSLVMTAAFTLIRIDRWKSLSLEQTVRGLIMYTLTMTAMVLLQYLLELYVEAQYANISVIIGSVITLLISGTLGAEYEKINLLLFPNLAFAQKNGIITEGGTWNFHMIALGWILFVNIILGALCLKILKKKDIF